MGAYRDSRVSFYQLGDRWGYNIQLDGHGEMRAAQLHTKTGAQISAWFAAQRLKQPIAWGPKQ